MRCVSQKLLAKVNRHLGWTKVFLCFFKHGKLLSLQLCWMFEGWIAPVEGDVHKARCLYCRAVMRAHFNDIKDHSATRKHATNVAFGKPWSSDCSSFDQNEPLPHRKAINGRRLLQPRKPSRFGKML